MGCVMLSFNSMTQKIGVFNVGISFYAVQIMHKLDT